MSYIIAVDFDGTLCKNQYPEIGEPNNALIEYLKVRQQKMGHKLILWTCRIGDKLEQAIDWCRDHGLIFDAVNQNLPEIVESFGGDCRKIFAHEYIDDRNSGMGKTFIAYSCDGNKCENCNIELNECAHTFDIRHARNFKKVGSNYYEENLNFKANAELMLHSQKNNRELITRTEITA